MLRPVYQWELDKDGVPKRDRFGERIPHPKIGQPKAMKDYSPDEKKDWEYFLNRDKENKRAAAAAVVAPVRDAERTLRELEG